MSLSEVAYAVNGKLRGNDTEIEGVTTDTRTLAAGDLFVALRGPQFDGHAFIDQAREQHAAGVMVSVTGDVGFPRVRVSDTRAALGTLGAYWRMKFQLPVAAVTGSNGKTTVKEMLGAILRVTRNGIVNPGNYNNDIGVPLTLCRLRAHHQFAVVELGMNHPGEIEHLSRMAKPDVAIITNVAPAHLEGLGSIQDVAAAKAEIFVGLAETGVAILNADDEFVEFWRNRAVAHKSVTFGLNEDADIWADVDPSPSGSCLDLHTPIGTAAAIKLGLPGVHNAYNALAAASAALEFGASLEQMRQGLESMTPMTGRLVLRQGIRGAQIFDDTYNANPASLQAGLEVLATVPGERFLVLGDMAELGTDTRAWHAEAGQRARALGIQRLFGLGPFTREAVATFGAAGRHFDTHQELITALEAELHADAILLVKGSRRMKMETVVNALVTDQRPSDPAGGLH